VTCSKCHQDCEADSAFCRHCGAAAHAASFSARRVVRLPDEGRLAGVCAGLAAYFNADVTLVRLAWVTLSVVPGVLIGGVVAYVAAWLLISVGGPQERPAPSANRLARSETNRTIGGVCGGLAEFFGIDATIVRLLAVVLAVYPGAVIGGVIAYLVAWFIMPPSKGGLPDTSAMNA
jgi:phage shock protein C